MAVIFGLDRLGPLEEINNVISAAWSHNTLFFAVAKPTTIAWYYYGIQKYGVRKQRYTQMIKKELKKYTSLLMKFSKNNASSNLTFPLAVACHLCFDPVECLLIQGQQKYVMTTLSLCWTCITGQCCWWWFSEVCDGVRRVEIFFFYLRLTTNQWWLCVWQFNDCSPVQSSEPPRADCVNVTGFTSTCSICSIFLPDKQAELRLHLDIIHGWVLVIFMIKSLKYMNITSNTSHFMPCKVKCEVLLND